MDLAFRWGWEMGSWGKALAWGPGIPSLTAPISTAIKRMCFVKLKLCTADTADTADLQPDRWRDHSLM